MSQPKSTNDAIVHKCGDCRKLNTNEKRCSLCHLVYFCDETCCKNGWNEHRKLCKFIRETNPPNLISVARQRIAQAVEEKRPDDVIMFVPLLQMIIHGQNDQYKQSLYGTFGRAFHELITRSVNTSIDPKPTQLNKMKHHFIEMSIESAKLYGEHNQLMFQGLVLIEAAHQFLSMNMMKEAKSY